MDNESQILEKSNLYSNTKWHGYINTNIKMLFEISYEKFINFAKKDYDLNI